MRRWILVSLAVVCVGALGTAWFQYNRLRQAEQILGRYWSNDFASVFSNLGVANQELQRIAINGELGEDTGLLLARTLSDMTPPLTNTLGATRRYLPNVPHVPHLIGYLDRARESVNRHLGLNVPRPLTPEERKAFREYADLSTQLTAIVKEYYPDYPGNGGGFTSDDNYWVGFLSDNRWRELLGRMDARADEAGFF